MVSSPKAHSDGRIVRGQHTRDAILAHAAEVASVDGLDGLSIGRLATELQLSKSGVFAHFGSKEDLQLAVVGAAADVFTRRVTMRVLSTPPGVRRVWRVAETWLAYSRQRTFPGGCFFRSAASDFASRPGRVRDAVGDAQRAWIAFYERTIDEAKELGEMAEHVDTAQLAFELDALAMLADLRSTLFDSTGPYELAARAILVRVRSATVDPKDLPAEP